MKRKKQNAYFVIDQVQACIDRKDSAGGVHTISVFMKSIGLPPDSVQARAVYSVSEISSEMAILGLELEATKQK